MNHIYTLLFLLCPFVLQAQYTGGQGDGADDSKVIQLDLSGIPGGVQALYIGGLGDGQHYALVSASIGGTPAHIWYAGGAGDGHHHAMASASLGGVQTQAWYGGGQGDGHHYTLVSTSLGGTPTDMWYAGGSGDGHHHAMASVSLGGVQTQAWYGGGQGDGHHQYLTSAALNGQMLSIYAGGSGDGYDKNNAQFLLNGISLRALYAGGAGDGHSNRRYEGIIPLPLTLISFEAIPEADYVLLQWQTENEVNTDFFTIEKTKKGLHFNEVGQLLAAGNSLPEERLYYEMKDHQPYQGRSYYRLKTTDFDGQVSHSHLVAVNYSSNQNWAFNLFPNPNTGKQLNVKLLGLAEEERLVFSIFDMNGKLVLKNDFRATDQSITAVELKDKLAAGSYLIRLEHPHLGQQSKILIVGGY